MKKELQDFVVSKTHELMNAVTCCEELKEAAKQWLEAIGTDNELLQTKMYVKELEEDIVTIDNLIGFSSSKEGQEYFGKEKANEIYQHALAIKQEGALYCDCPACSLVFSILEKKDELLEG